MPEEDAQLLATKLDAQTLRMDEGFAALSGEVQVNHEEIKRLAMRVDGDTDRPGLMADVADLKAKQGQDDDLRKYGGMVWKAAKWAAIPAFAVLSAIATAALADHARIGVNEHQIDVVKTRIAHVEELRAVQEEHHQELLDAIGGED